jgi:hypothetical protein
MSDDSISQFVPFSNGPDDNEPLPLRVSRKYGFSLAYHVIDGEHYYAVQDWLRGVAQTPEPRKFWNSMQRRFKKAGLEMSSRWRQLAYIAADGKKYKIDHANAEGLYIITQRMDAQTGLRDQVLQYLARAGVLVDDIYRDPGVAIEIGIAGFLERRKDPLWAQAYTNEIISHARFMDALEEAVWFLCQGYHYEEATDAVFDGLYERTKQQLLKEMGLKSTIRLEMHQSMIALGYQMIAKEIAREHLGERSELNWEEAKMIIRKAAALIAPQVQATSQALGVDVPTGKPLIPRQTGE